MNKMTKKLVICLFTFILILSIDINTAKANDTIDERREKYRKWILYNFFRSW